MSDLDVKWTVTRVVGASAGTAAFLLGLWTSLSLLPLCVGAGVWVAASGFLVVALEVPCACAVLDNRCLCVCVCV